MLGLVSTPTSKELILIIATEGFNQRWWWYRRLTWNHEEGGGSKWREKLKNIWEIRGRRELMGVQNCV